MTCMDGPESPGGVPASVALVTGFHPRPTRQRRASPCYPRHVHAETDETIAASSSSAQWPGTICSARPAIHPVQVLHSHLSRYCYRPDVT